MAHALAAFIQQRMDEKKLRQRDVVAASGLSRALVSKYAADDREKLGRLPERETLEGFAKALTVPIDVLIGKAVEALGLGYTSGDFINGVTTAHYRDLLDELERRLAEGGGAHAGSAAPTNQPPDEGGADVRLGDSDPGSGSDLIVRRYLKQADGDVATAASLLAHDGAKGANTDEDTWFAALEQLHDQAPAGVVVELPQGVAARRSKKRPPKGPGEQGAD